MSIKNAARFWGIIALVAIIGFSLTGCPPEPHTHDWGNWVVTTPATATNPGEETRTCNTCGEKVTRPIPATGNTHTHTYATAWTYDTAQHWKECTANDGAKTDEAAHTSGDWIVDQAATATTAGSRHKECTVCGYETETETIPVLDPECDCTVKVHPFGTPCSCSLAQCDCVTEIQKKFPITVGSNTITIVDGRANNTAGTQLDSAIINKFDPLFEAVAGDGGDFDTIAPRGLVITVREGVEGGYYKPVDGNHVDIDFDFASTANLNSAGNRSRFNTAMNGMVNLPYDGEIQREFPITNGEYTVIIKDGRTSEATETLEDLGVITKFEAMLTHAGITGDSGFINIAPRGLMIILESGVEYVNYKAIDGNTVGANLEWVLETNIANTGSRGIFTYTLGTMDALTFTQR